MTLAYKIKGSDAKKQVVVPIVPPLSGYDDVKPRLLEMKAKAQEGLGMVGSLLTLEKAELTVTRLKLLKSRLSSSQGEH